MSFSINVLIDNNIIIWNIFINMFKTLVHISDVKTCTLKTYYQCIVLVKVEACRICCTSSPASKASLNFLFMLHYSWL